MGDVNICLDCEEEFVGNMHDACLNKFIFSLKKFLFQGIEIASFEIKKNIFIGRTNERLNNWDLKLIKILMNRDSPRRKVIITIFPNKKESNNFFNNVLSSEVHAFNNTGYTYAQDLKTESGILAINREGIDLESLDIVFDLHLEPIDFNEKQITKVIRLHDRILNGYLDKMGIDPIPDINQDSREYFKAEIIPTFNIYRRLKQKSIINSLGVKNYACRLIKLVDPERINKNPNFENILTCFLIVRRFSLIKLSVKGTPIEPILSNIIDEFISLLLNFKEEYSELNNLLRIVYNDIETNDVKDIDSYILKLRRDIDFILDNITPIYSRLKELLFFIKESDDILFQLQLGEKKKIFGKYDFFYFLEKLDEIESKCKERSMLYLLKSTQLLLINEYVATFHDDKFYELAVKKCEDTFSVGLELMKSKEKGGLIYNNISWGDIVGIWSGLSYTSFYLNKIDDFKKYQDKFKKLLDEYPCSSKQKIGWHIFDFWITEKEEDLIKIIELYEVSKTDSFLEDSGQFKMSYLLSKFFLEKDPQNKKEYIDEILDLNETFPIQPLTFQKDMSQVSAFRGMFNMLKYLWGFLSEKDNSFFGMLQLDYALKIAEEIRKKSKPIDINYKWASKTILIGEVIKSKDLESIERLIIELENSWWDDKIFIKNIKDLIDFIKKGNSDKINLFLKGDLPRNFFEQIIYKIMKEKLIEGYKSYALERNQIKNLEINEILKSFKKIVERDVVTSFWVNKNTPREKPEVIGRDMLIVFLRALDFDPSKEEEMGYKKKADIIIREIQGKKIIIETKMGNSPSYVVEGLENIKNYYDLEKGLGKEIEVYYIIFIFRDNIDSFNEEYTFGDGKIAKVIKIDVRSDK